MGQYFKAYSTARKSVADMDYLHYGNIISNAHNGTPEEISEIFDDIEEKMGAEFGEYFLVGDYGLVIFRTGNEQNPSFDIEYDTKGLKNIVWNTES